MTPPTPGGPQPPPPPTPEGAGAPAPESLLQTVQALWHELPGLVNDRIELLSLELQRAGSALSQIVVLVVASAILGVTAWLVLWGLAVTALVGWGVGLPWALAAALLLNVLAAVLAVMRARALLPGLRLPATRRHLMLSPSTQPRAAAPVSPPPERHEPTPAGEPAAR